MNSKEKFKSRKGCDTGVVFFLLAKVREETLDKIKNTCRFRFCEMKPEKKIQIYYFFQGVRRVRKRCATSRKKVQGFEIK